MFCFGREHDEVSAGLPTSHAKREFNSDILSWITVFTHERFGYFLPHVLFGCFFPLRTSVNEVQHLTLLNNDCGNGVNC